MDVLGSTEPGRAGDHAAVRERGRTGFSEDAAAVVGIYGWETRDAADAFYSDECVAGVTERCGAAPDRQDWIVPAVAESADGRVVGDALLAR